MRVLVEYLCRQCHVSRESWVVSPVPTSRTCEDCGSAAGRRFGGALLTSSERASRQQASLTPPARGGCQDHANLPGGCVLTPTAARALSARARRDNRALDREFAYQEAAVKAGQPDAASTVIQPSAAHSVGE